MVARISDTVRDMEWVSSRVNAWADKPVDAVLQVPGSPPRILEVDESQHFNGYRANTLSHYAGSVPLAFDARSWSERSVAKPRLEAGGCARPCPPLFPGPNGRHRQRAFRDALSDILPPSHEFAPTLRIGDFEVRSWINTVDAASRMEELLATKFVSGCSAD